MSENLGSLDPLDRLEAAEDLRHLLRIREINPFARVILINDKGLPISDDEKRQLNVSLGRNPEIGIGEDAPGI